MGQEEAAASVAVEHVSKRFVLKNARHGDLREKFSPRFRQSAPAKASSAFWALDDVSFAVRPGEALGIVGHNGSGKSTMLKLLTGIMKPTTGAVNVRGRIGALIEVSAGFHPDLTGRENVFLNGSILGLERREIAARLDRIVDFAGLEMFIDTPVKRYSSGMYMRLGFAIAAHMDPDVLLIDEVLAVGDTQFQRKCMARMKEFLGQGGTVLFVSHGMAHVAELCQRSVWLDHGKLLYDGPTGEAVDRYMAVIAEREDAEFKRLHPDEWAEREARVKAEERAAQESARQAERAAAEAAAQKVRAAREAAEAARRREAALLADPSRSCLLGATLEDADGKPADVFTAGAAMRVRMAYRFARPRKNPIIGFEIVRSDGLYMFAASNFQYDLAFPDLPLRGEMAFTIPFLALNEGTYRLRLSLFPEPSSGPDWDRRPEHVIEEAATFRVSAGPLAHGCAFLPIEWDRRSVAAELITR